MVRLLLYLDDKPTTDNSIGFDPLFPISFLITITIPVSHIPPLPLIMPPQILCHGCNRSFSPRGLSHHLSRSQDPRCRTAHGSRVQAVSPAIQITTTPLPLNQNCTSLIPEDNEYTSEFEQASDTKMSEGMLQVWYSSSRHTSHI